MTEMSPFRSRPETSLEQMVRDHGPYLQKLARALVGDLHRADDLVSETWAVALAASHTGGAGHAISIREPRGWLSTVLRRRARHAYRSDALRSSGELPESHPSKSADQMGVALQLERERLLHGALEQLDEPYRMTLFLRYREELPPRKIAERMGVPVKTVNTRLARGLEKLRGDLIEAHGGGEEGRRAWLSAMVPLAVMKPRHAASLAPAKVLSAAALMVSGAVGAALMLGPSKAEADPLPGVESAALAAAAPEVDPASASELATSTPGITAPNGSRAAVSLTSGQASELPGYAVRLLSATGAPLAGEAIFLRATSRPGSAESFSTGVTDDSGTALFDWAGTRRVTAFNGSGTAFSRSDYDFEAVHEPLTEPMAIELRMQPGIEVSVTVKDADGSPVPFAVIHASHGEGAGLAIEPVAVCDVSGQCRVALAASAMIRATLPGRTWSECLRVSKLPEVAQDLRGAILILGGEGAPLSGRVTSAGGVPLEGAWVRVAPEDIWIPKAPGRTTTLTAPLCVRTDADGQYTLPAALLPRAYKITAFTRDLAAQMKRVEASDVPLEVDFTLREGATVSGRVLSDDGAPAVGSYVRYWAIGQRRERLDGAPFHSASTDIEGRFELTHVQAGDFMFRASNPSGTAYARANREHAIPTSGSVSFDLVLSFEPRISGRVVDEAGLPVEGLFVEANLGQWTSYPVRIRTDAEGRFDLAALPNRDEYDAADAAWNLAFTLEGSSARAVVGKVTGIEPGTTDVEVVVNRPVAASAFITGRFVRADGPISSAVEFFLAGVERYGWLGAIEVDPIDGSFTYGPLGAGVYRFFISDPNGDSVGLLGMQVADGETLDVGDVDTGRGGQLALSLNVELPDFVPQSILPELLRDQSLILEGPGGHLADLVFEDMTFRSRAPLEPGDWRLFRSNGEHLVLPATTVTIEPRETAELTLQARIGRPLVVKVLMATDGTWKSAAIRTYGADGVELETSPAQAPSDLDDEERLKLEVEAPIESVRVVVVIDGVESAFETTVTVPSLMEPFESIEVDAR